MVFLDFAGFNDFFVFFLNFFTPGEIQSQRFLLCPLPLPVSFVEVKTATTHFSSRL